MKNRRAPFRWVPFSKKQLKVLTWWMPDSPVHDKDGIICDGSVRAGKTIVMSFSFAIWAMENFVYQNFIMAGKTIGAFRRNVLVLLKIVLRLRGYNVQDKRADNLLIIRSRRTGVKNYFYIFGGRDERSQDLVQGITAAGAFFDEVALMPESFVNQAIARCSVDGSKLWFNCNPEGPYHWFKVEFLDKLEEKNLIHIHFTMDDNPALSEATKERYKRMFAGVFFKRYILGLWVAAEGIIYILFADNPENFIVDDVPEPIHYATIGVDFGGSKSAHSFTLTGFTRGFKQVVILDEFYHNNVTQGRLSPAQVEEKFVDFVKRAKQKYRLYEAYCDSAEQTLIEGLTVAAAKNGLGIQIKNAIKGPINDRIAFYCSLMAQGRFCIMRHCKATIEALASAVYDEKKKTEDVRLDDGKVNVDSLDSMEYSTEHVQSAIMYLSLRG